MGEPGRRLGPDLRGLLFGQPLFVFRWPELSAPAIDFASASVSGARQRGHFIVRSPILG